LVVATALIVLLAAHRFGVVNVPILQDSGAGGSKELITQHRSNRALLRC
jgi:hypothetical protein